MSSTILKLNGNHTASIKELAYILKTGINAELVSESWREFDGISIVLLVLEKFYLRNGNYATLTILLTEQGDNQTADITGSGAGSGIFNISLGANANFTETARLLLKQYGFQ